MFLRVRPTICDITDHRTEAHAVQYQPDSMIMTNNQSDEPQPEAVLPQHVSFFYIKSQFFRVIHVDGAIGGITPRGFIHCAVYSERAAIPQEQEIEITDGLHLGKILKSDGKAGIVREVDADIMLTKTAAIELRDWLTARIDEVTRLESMKIKR